MQEIWLEGMVTSSNCPTVIAWDTEKNKVRRLITMKAMINYIYIMNLRWQTTIIIVHTIYPCPRIKFQVNKRRIRLSLFSLIVSSL